MSDALHDLGLVGAGIAGGFIGSVAGLASLATYPALLAVGVTPVAANVTNTVSLVAAGAGSLWGSRKDLAGQQGRLAVLLPIAVVAGAVGAVVVLAAGSGSFQRIVPWLIAFAAVLILVPRERLVRHRAPAGQAVEMDEPAEQAAVDLAAELPRRRPPRERFGIGALAAVSAVCFYGGYFGAGAGVLMLALFLALFDDPLPVSNALKNLLLGVSNLVAAIVFALHGTVVWNDALFLGIGCFLGGRLGPPVVRLIPAAPLRTVIAVAGLGLAVYLAVDAY